jgi:hypothetical protein
VTIVHQQRFTNFATWIESKTDANERLDGRERSGFIDSAFRAWYALDKLRRFIANARIRDLKLLLKEDQVEGILGLLGFLFRRHFRVKIEISP